MSLRPDCCRTGHCHRGRSTHEYARVPRDRFRRSFARQIKDMSRRRLASPARHRVQDQRFACPRSRKCSLAGRHQGVAFESDTPIAPESAYQPRQTETKKKCHCTGRQVAVMREAPRQGRVFWRTAQRDPGLSRRCWFSCRAAGPTDGACPESRRPRFGLRAVVWSSTGAPRCRFRARQSRFSARGPRHALGSQGRFHSPAKTHSRTGFR
jgi:hypothetical protein